MSDRKPMTIKQLIELLQKDERPDRPVMCTAEANCVYVNIVGIFENTDALILEGE